MLFKIDENLHEEVAGLLREHGHDALSVYEQRLRGIPDDDLAAVCKREGRAGEGTESWQQTTEMIHKSINTF
jgi:hypothetical protein